MRSRASAVTFVFAIGALISPRLAFAYDEEVHTFLVRAAIGEGHGEETPPIPPDAPEVVRRAIDQWARTSTDTAVRDAWTKRYPTPESFDAWAEKELLLLSQAAVVWGIDRLPTDGIKTVRDAIELGSRQPDDDWRNRERYAYDAHREPLKDRLGAMVPADPAILNMGRMGTLSSQAHGHYGLPDIAFSSDPEVLAKDPRRFALCAGYPPGPTLALAAEMSELHLDLALVAALLDEPSPTLSWLYTGQAFHYTQDVSNQIHTVQVGLYNFFVDATKERWKMGVITGGGYVGPLRTMASIGADILTNHHVYSEQLAKKRVLDALAGKVTAEGTRLLDAPKTDDDAFRAKLDAALAKSGGRPAESAFGLVLTRAVIDTSSYEGPEVYAATRTIASPKLRRAGFLYDDKREDPDTFLAEGAPSAGAYKTFFDLQEKAFRRAGTVTRRWLDLQGQLVQAASADPAERQRLRGLVIGRLVRRQLALLGQAEARRADYLRNPPVSTEMPQNMPAMAFGEVVLLVGLVVGTGYWLRKRRLAHKPPAPPMG